MRKRKTANTTIIRQYKYRASTDLRPMPAELWDVARRMQQAWNLLIPAYAASALCALNTANTASWEQFRVDKDDAAYKARKKKSDAERRELWIAWDKTAREIVKQACLDYSQGPNVIERFNAGIKAGRTCKVETNNPLQPQHCQIPFVFPGSAAIPVSRVTNPAVSRRWRIVLEGYTGCAFDENSQPARRGRRQVYLELGLSRNVTIPLRVDFHRQLPSNGVIKRVLLCGRKLPFRGWRWHVLFQIEMPVVELHPQTPHAVFLRICWTRFEDSIIAAQWRDEAGQKGILTLPLSPMNAADRNTRERHPEWDDWIYSYKDLDAFQTTEFSLPKGSEERMRMRERRRRVVERWQARRRWLYRNFAAWLLRKYAAIHMADLDIKGIAEDDRKQGALAGGDHWRQVAAPGDLIAIVKDGMAKHGRRVCPFSQTSVQFESVEGLRNRIAAGDVQVFEIGWNSRVVAEGVHTE